MLANHRSTIEIPSRFHRLWLPIENTYTAEKCGSKPWLERWNNYTACCYYQHFCPLFFTSSFFFSSLPLSYIVILLERFEFTEERFFFFFTFRNTRQVERGVYSCCNLLLEISIRKNEGKKDDSWIFLSLLTRITNCGEGKKKTRKSFVIFYLCQLREKKS